MNVTHFDDFARADTAPGTVSAGRQGQAYEVFSSFLLAPDTVTRIRNGRLYTPPQGTDAVRASYTMTTAAAAVKRLGAVIEYSQNSETETGVSGYIWAVMLSTRRSRFTDEMIHFTGSHRDWKLEIWYPNGTRRTLGSGAFATPLAFGQKGVVDLTLLNHTTIRVTVPGGSQSITDADLLRFTNARYPIVEHYIPARTLNIQQFRAWYYQVDGASALAPAVFAPFEP